MREWQGSDFVAFQLESYFSCVAFVVSRCISHVQASFLLYNLKNMSSGIQLSDHCRFLFLT